MIYHQVQLESPVEFDEIENQATDGTTYYAMSVSNVIPNASPWANGRDADPKYGGNTLLANRPGHRSAIGVQQK